MTPTKRPILSLTGLMKPEEDGPLDLATYDVQLPCRWFEIDHKIAVLGRVSLTAEFLLRLLKSADGLDEASAAAFFGFDLRDMSFVLSEVEGEGYVQRREGRLWLTLAGQSLFRSDSDQPQIFEVEAVRENVGFDLISFAPEPKRYLEDFEFCLPELAVRPEIASSATQHIPGTFRRFYPEIQARRERKRDDKKSLYSVDNVSAGDRFPATVRISVKSTGMRPHAGEPDLSDWRSEPELEDRPNTVDAASAFVDRLVTTRHSADGEAYAVLLELAPEFLKEFTRRDGLNVERYYREAFSRAGEVRSDRPTLPIVGALLGEKNLRRAMEVVSYGLRKEAKPASFLWLAPMMHHWGATQLLPEFLKLLKAQLRQKQTDPSAPPAMAVGLATGRPESHLERAFDALAVSDVPRFPRILEVLLVPGVMASVTVHAPIGSQTGLPVPLGFISFDPRVVGRTQAYMAERVGPMLRNKPFETAVMETLLSTGADDAEGVPEAANEVDQGA
ncbi:hypothetical protein G5B46_06425 [Caulobacter sp. 602-2]|uniref:Uncharacterized protein n=1 Tax=Caulobacter sp. 602-2 TaxID=2710887 RepID=A0A6G4QUW8_9CAUL|nr:hypothetical protein [Caulobacter sp. 602-2]NGM49237.1 hypothetical protein [Caulobacter sp. 602-2]